MRRSRVTTASSPATAARRSPVVEQLTFADFLTAGEFDRHLRRMRPRYRTRWGARLPDLVPAGTSAGLPLVTWLPDDLDEPAVVAAAAARGLAVYGLAPYRIAPGRAGLLFGYGALDESAISEGVRLPAESVAVVRGG